MALWIAASELLGPRLTTATLRAGGAWEYVLLLWTLVASRSAIVAILSFCLLSAALRSTVFVRAHVSGATPRSLACLRVLVCSILLASVLWERLPSTADLPPILIQPMGVMKLAHQLPGFDAWSRSAAALGAFQVALAALLALGALGWRARLVLPLAALGYLVLGGLLRQYSWFFHTGLVPLYVLFVLSVTPCADALSLDRRRWARHGRTLPAPDQPAAVYGWSRYACWIVVALPYFFAGLSKIRNGGGAWFAGSNLKSILLRDTLDPMEFDWRLSLRLAELPDGAFTVMAALAVGSEIAYVSVLFSRRARRILPPLTAALHLGIWFLQNILFFDLILLQLVFLDWERLARRVEAARSGGVPSPSPGVAAAPRERASAGAVAPPADERVAAATWAPRLRFVAGILFFCWLALVEQYPFTAFQMYSGAASTDRVSYLRVEAHHASGETARAPIERLLPALRDSRYRVALRGCFDESGRPACDALLTTLLERERRSGTADPMQRIEVQLRSWIFASPPAAPEDGRVTRSYRFPA